MDEPRSKGWFEMVQIRRRLYSKAAWIPLREVRTEAHEDGAEEFYGSGCIAFYIDRRLEAEKLGWSEIGICHDAGPYAFEDGRYKICETYKYNGKEDLGFDLVFVQRFSGDHPDIWHLNQDLVFALRLLQEGDVWIKPDEGHVEVVRQSRDAAGAVKSIEIKSEFLRDYLTARGAALKIALYRERSQVVENASHIDWPKGRLSHDTEDSRYEGRLLEVDRDGGLYGGGVAVFHVWRTDVDLEEEVPVYGSEGAGNTGSASRSFQRGGPKFFRIVGEFWREEWIEPASRSERVRGDEPTEVLSFIIDGAGNRELSTNLYDEDVGRWLWFNPAVVSVVMNRRGGGLAWYTAETGSVWCSVDCKTHFGVNSAGLVNVYACDIAKLPIWQQRIWASYNVTPDSPVSIELLMSQMQASPAITLAPEAQLRVLFDDLDKAAINWTGQALFKEHDAAPSILLTIHRFRALEGQGILALAKDVARLVADRIDIGGLRKLASPSQGEKWGSLKSLEKALATIVGEGDARIMLAPLVGVYELRLGDAHLPSSEIDEAYSLAGVDQNIPRLEQGRQLLTTVVQALVRIRDVMLTARPPVVSTRD